MTCRWPLVSLLGWIAFGLLAGSGRAVELPPPAAPLPEKIEIAPGPFQPTWDSFKQYKCPDWFRDAKLGIWAVWGPESVPEQGDWYARRLYDPADAAYKYHVDALRPSVEVRLQGHHPALEGRALGPRPSDGALQEGRREILLHDRRAPRQFRLLELEVSAVELRQLGPKRDIAGEWQKAATSVRPAIRHDRAPGGKLVVLRSGQGGGQDGPAGRRALRRRRSRGLPTCTGPTTCVPRGTTTPRRRMPCSGSGSTASSDMIDRYHPDLLYSDSGFRTRTATAGSCWPITTTTTPGSTAAAWRRFTTASRIRKAMWVQDLERGVMDKICPVPWQTDTCVGGWYYDVEPCPGTTATSRPPR